MNTLFTALTWWQSSLLAVYSLYSLIRAFWIFNCGLREAMVGMSTDIKLYHCLWAIIDIPAIIMGCFFPVLKFLFNVPVFSLRKEKR